MPPRICSNLSRWTISRPLHRLSELYRDAIQGVMGTNKDSADKAKADVERVEAEEDEALAKTGQRPGKRTQADRARGASANQRIK